MEQKTLFFEKVENRLINEVVAYINRCENTENGEEFDPAYFDKYISVQLYNGFVNGISENIKNLNDSDKKKQCLNLYNQFVVNTPEKRKYAIYQKFIKQFSQNVNTENYDKKYFSPLMIAYSNHFIKFKEYLNIKSYGSLASQTEDMINSISGFFTHQPTTLEIALNSTAEAIRKASKKMQDQRKLEVDNYLVEWKNKTITLLQWQHNKNVDVLYELGRKGISNEITNGVARHQLKLYKEFVNSKIHNYIAPFEEINNETNRKEVAKRDLDLINFIIDGNIDELKEKRIQSTFHFKDWKYIHLVYGLIQRNRYHSKDNYNIHSKECWADAEAIFKIRNYLIAFINPKEEDTKTETSKGDKKAHALKDAFKCKNFQAKISKITKMLESLKKYGFVSEDTNIKNFRLIFNNTKPEILIQWNGNISELAYFVNLLHDQYELIEKMTLDKWKVTDKLFVDKNKEPFGWERFRGQKTPASAVFLENAVEFLQ